MLQAHRRGLENFEVTVTNVSQPNNTPQETAVQAFLAENQGAGAEVVPFEVAPAVPAEMNVYAEYFQNKARQQLLKDLSGGDDDIDDEFTQEVRELLGISTRNWKKAFDSDYRDKLKIVYWNLDGTVLSNRNGEAKKEFIAQIRCGQECWRAFAGNKPIRLYKKPRNDAELQQILRALRINADLKLKDFKWRYMLYFNIPQPEEAEQTEEKVVKVHAIDMPATSGINFKNSYIKQLTRKRIMVTEVLTRITISRQTDDSKSFPRLEFEALDMEGKPLGVKTSGVK